MKTLLLYAIAGCSIFITVTMSGADKPHFPVVGPKTDPTYARLHDPKYWAGLKKGFDALADHRWLSEAWTGNDAPYARLRSAIDKQIVTTPSLTDFVAGYAATAHNNPDDPLAQFGWGYAVDLATRDKDFKVDNESDLFNSVNFALAEAPSPHVYDYDRLRYMMWMLEVGGWASHYLTGMGERLLQKNPADFSIQIDQAQIYTESHDPQSRQQGYVLIQTLIKEHPSEASVYDTLACWYYSEMLAKHDAADYHAAVANYQKAEAMYPPNSARRASMPAVLQWLGQLYGRLHS